MIRGIKQGSKMPLCGIYYVIDDNNAHANMRFVFWAFTRLIFRVRLRKWAVVKDWPNASFLERVRKIFIFELCKQHPSNF